jgi:hypothetical protein
VEALFQQFASRKYNSVIAGKTIHPQSSSFSEKINTTEEMCGMHEKRMEERHKVLLSTV